MARAVLVGLLGVTSASYAESIPPATQKSAATQPAVSAFDPAKHMPVSEVKPGMKGYGLSVFSGTKIERFEVEVISVLVNFNPKSDVILIKCKGQNLEHTGAVAGMSGSPIYLTDSAGKDRMIGAFAYGWSLSKDPLAGVQPIEYMLSIPTGTPAKDAINGKPIADKSSSGEAKPTGRWSMKDAQANWQRFISPESPAAGTLAVSKSVSAKTDGPITKLEPLATPLMMSGVSSKVLDRIAPLFIAHGLTPLQAGSSSSSPQTQPAPKIEPGSVLAVPMVIGDMDMTAIGTTTEVVNGQVYGFGHPFNNEGQVLLPLGSGYINHIVATLSTSFKLGSMIGPAGVITADRSVGIAGRMGESPKLAPVDLRVTYTDGSADTNYHFESIVHPRFTPLLCGMAIMSALAGTSDLPAYNTVDYDINLQFSNGKTIKLSDTVANAADRDLFRFVGLPLLTAADNPFTEVLVEKVSGEIRVSKDVKLGQISDVNLPRSTYRPGETLTAYIEVKQFRGGDSIVPVELELPKDLTDGNYQLVISDWTRYMQDEQTSKPFRFTGESVDELFDALTDFTSIRQNAVYLRLVRQADGVAIGRTTLPKLPSSRRQMLLGAGRSSTTRFVSSVTRTIPMPTVMQGAADFVISIDSDAKVEVGKGGTPVRADTPSAAPAVLPAAPAAPAPAPPDMPEPPAPPKPPTPME